MKTDKFCKVCNKLIHPKRVELGYKDTCIEHSSTVKYSGIVSATGKSDYEINIVKDPDQAKHIASISNIY